MELYLIKIKLIFCKLNKVTVFIDFYKNNIYIKKILYQVFKIFFFKYLLFSFLLVNEMT